MLFDSPGHSWLGAIGLAAAVGFAYFMAARLGLALRARERGRRRKRTASRDGPGAYMMIKSWVRTVLRPFSLARFAACSINQAALVLILPSG